MIILFVLIVYSLVPCVTAFNDRNSSSRGSSKKEIVFGENTPLGPLSKYFISKIRYPGFPFELPSFIPGNNERYLIFPSPDGIADYQASQRRCESQDGKLVDIMSTMELEVLGCAISFPSFVGRWKDQQKGEVEKCNVLYPGGILSNSRENCGKSFGSICKITASKDYPYL